MLHISDSLYRLEINITTSDEECDEEGLDEDEAGDCLASSGDALSSSSLLLSKSRLEGGGLDGADPVGFETVCTEVGLLEFTVKGLTGADAVGNWE